MWIQFFALRERVAARSHHDARSHHAIAWLIFLPLLCIASGCKKQATPEDRLAAQQEKLVAAITKLPQPPKAPAVVPQPTPASELPDWKPSTTSGI